MRRPERVECLYIDFDGFFASVEKQLDRRLHDRPVGVTPLDGPNAGLIATCYEAKLRGVQMGMRKREARAICPDIAVVVARPDRYVAMHHAIRAIVNDHVPVTETARSIDELSVALLPSEAQRAMEIGRAIKLDLAARIGPAITCSIGFGPNELIAKIAAERDKPNGLTVIEPDDLLDTIVDLPLRSIPGIARGIEARLTNAGVRNAVELWNMAPKHARAVWGSVEGERFVAMLHGYAVERRSTTRLMFGHSRVLPGMWRDPMHAYECARLLTVKAARRMRREGFRARALHFGVRIAAPCWERDRSHGADPWFGHEAAFEPARDDRTLQAALASLHEQARRRNSYARVGSVSITLHGLVRDDAMQGDLLETETARLDRLRWERITDLCDAMHTRHGPAMLSLGPRPAEPPGGYAGAKIAFGRIPDPMDFDIPVVPIPTQASLAPLSPV